MNQRGSPIQPHALPENALLGTYARGESYTDCYATEVPASVSHAEYVEAFYTTAVFKLERLLLAWFVSKPSSDAQAKQLADGELNSFAAWDVEARSADQLLMCDFRGRTRSWLMVAPIQSGDAAATRLYFGSAVVPIVNRASGDVRFGFAFRALLGFHKLYSRVLLRAACSRLARSRQARQIHEATPTMLKLRQLFAPRSFVAHGAPRLQSLEGSPLASFQSRAIAFTIDLVIFNFIMAAASILWSLAHSDPAPIGAVKVVNLHTWWALAAVVVYFGAFTFLGRGQTPGKRLMGIRVVSLVHERIGLWHSIERALGYGASALELGFGFLQYFIHPNAQTVHDRIAETIVVSERFAGDNTAT